jgi:peptide/nickel transport system substrate-binding protein
VDAHLNAARATTDIEARKAEYQKAAEIYLADRQRIYLYHQNWFWALSSKVKGFKPHPDGMIRLEGVSVSK